MTKQQVESLFRIPTPMHIKAGDREQDIVFEFIWFDKEREGYVVGTATIPDVWYNPCYSVNYSKLTKTETGIEYEYFAPIK
jgi:hypothetical protein